MIGYLFGSLPNANPLPETRYETLRARDDARGLSETLRRGEKLREAGKRRAAALLDMLHELLNDRLAKDRAAGASAPGRCEQCGHHPDDIEET